MSMYRDPLAGLRSQIATKRGLLESRENSLPALLRAMLPERIARALKELRDRALAEPDSLEELTSTDSALDEILNAHAEAADLVPKLRECPDDVPDPRRPDLSPPWVFEESWQLSFRADVTRRLEAISPDAYLVRWDDNTYLSRIRVAGAPIVLSSRVVMIPGQLTTFHSTMRSSVPIATPSLEVRRERMLVDGIGRVVGLVRDAKVNDDAFDDAFIVDGADAVALLTPDVRAALTAMRELGPKLHVRRGVVELAWGKSLSSRGDELMPDEAFAVVLGIRAAIERA